MFLKKVVSYMWNVSVHHRETGTISKFGAQNF